jgi:FkbM family methyltransferase
MAFRHAVRRFAKRFGVDVRTLQPFSDEYETLVFMIGRFGAVTVLDIGSNDGGFAKNFLDAGYAHRIVSFEPLPDANARLSQSAKAHPNWIVMPPFALGRQEATAAFHVAGNSSSSSFLNMGKRHREVAPASAPVEEITVQVKRVDSVMEEFEPGSRESLFLKIDTQGSEADVLEGASSILHRVIGLRVELSFVELYEDQPLFDEMYAEIRTLGFELWECTPVLRDPRTGQVLQIDATFFRTNR